MPSIDLMNAGTDASVRRGKGKIMTENSEFEKPTESTGGGETAEEAELRGRYAEGRYGKTGVLGGRHTADEEGQYTEGDFAATGSEGGLPEPLGEKAREAGRFVKADYGDAGTAEGRTAESEVGQYSEGDYGTDGTVEPTRKAGPHKE
jgi:hypothetical protein